MSSQSSPRAHESSASESPAAWYQWDVDRILQEFQTNRQLGLSSDEAALRLEMYGENELEQADRHSAWQILWEQLSGPLVILLMIAGAISYYLGETTDAIVIAGIVILNAALGFFQEFRAERAMEALQKISVPTVRVRRDGRIQEISSLLVTPGDILLLEAGNLVAADGRLIESQSLKIQEAALTGESEPVEKTSETLSTDNLPLGDCRNMAFRGTNVTYGRGELLVTETGMRTQLGRIAHLLQSVDTDVTPLQVRLGQLGGSLALAALGLVALVFGMGVWRGEELKLLLLTAMSMAVAAVPEGLPAVSTVTLATGARRMLKRRALIRKLPAVETLGSVTVICSDKTGTLTENRMTVSVLDVAGDRVDLMNGLKRASDERGANIDAGEILERHSALALLLAGGDLCNDATLRWAEESHRDDHDALEVAGDPTEGALVIAAARLGLDKHRLALQFPRVAEHPFSSERKRMTTVHRLERGEAYDLSRESSRMKVSAQVVVSPAERLRDDDRQDFLAVTKGAVDSILEVSDRVWTGERTERLDDVWRSRIAEAQDRLAANGMRVLGIGMHWLDELPPQERLDEVERNVIFVGLVGMIDPPRAEAAEAVERCKSAGIRPMMITGDHPLTALHIAERLGIARDGERVVTGRELERMPRAELERIVQEASVYARVSPEHKLRIVEALQDLGEIVAMTGDGVNDAPALKKADIGIAMGVTGTDVSREAARMVLLDDNFATIVNAVEEGRIVYDNIRKFMRYALASNAGEVLVMLLAPLLGMPLPLLPLQILWINLVTDGLPGLALAFEPGERNTMQRPPHPPNEHILGRGTGFDILWIGMLLGGVSLAPGWWFWRSGVDEVYWRTMVFTVLTLSQMGNVLALRAQTDSLFRIGLFSNPLMVASVLLTVGLQFAVVYWPPLSRLFETVPLSARDLGICCGLSTVIFAAVEGVKWRRRRRQAQSR